MSDVAIRVEGLTKRFGTVTALDGIDLDVPARTVFGLLGPHHCFGCTLAAVLAENGRQRVTTEDRGRCAFATVLVMGHHRAVPPTLVNAAEDLARSLVARAEELLADAIQNELQRLNGGAPADLPDVQVEAEHDESQLRSNRSSKAGW